MRDWLCLVRYDLAYITLMIFWYDFWCNDMYKSYLRKSKHRQVMCITHLVHQVVSNNVHCMIIPSIVL